MRDTCLCLHIQRAARALARRFDEALRPLGLTNGQFSLMMSLNRPEPPRIGSVAALLAMDRDDAHRRPEAPGAARLGRGHAGPRGQAQPEADADARRSTLLASAVPIWHSTHGALEDLLGRSDPDRLRGDLRSLS